MTRRMRPLALAVLAAVALGACGGGGDDFSDADREALCARAQAFGDDATATTATLQDPATDLETARQALLDLIAEVEQLLTDVPDDYADLAAPDATSTTAATDRSLGDDAEAVVEQLAPIQDQIEDADLEELRTEVLADLVQLFQPPTLDETPATRLLGSVNDACG